MLQTVESALQTVYDGLTITPAFDGLAQSILITKITVPEHHNLVFRFIDGSIYRYRMTAATPKSKPGAYERKQNHERILALYARVSTDSEEQLTSYLPVVARVSRMLMSPVSVSQRISLPKP